MNIFKIALVMISGVGFGFGVDKIAETQVDPDVTNENELYYQNMNGGYCHGENFSFDHMLDDLSEEDQALVQGKIDELLLEMNISLEDLDNDFELRYEFMSELMIFLDDNGIEYHNHGDYNDNNHMGDYGYGGMGMH